MWYVEKNNITVKQRQVYYTWKADPGRKQKVEIGNWSTYTLI